MRHLLGGSLRGRQPSLWLLVGIAAMAAVLMLASLGPAGASRLFQSEEETSVIAPMPTETPEGVQPGETPAVQPPDEATAAAQATSAPGPTDAPPTAAAATDRPTQPQSTPVQVTAQPTSVGVAATYTPIATPGGTAAAGGPAPVVWIIVGLVLVGLVVVIVVSPGRKPKGSE